MTAEQDIMWSGRPWIGPSVAFRSLALLAIAIILVVLLAQFGTLTWQLYSLPILFLALGLIGLVWVASVIRLLVLRASVKYVLRRSSVEVDQGIARKKSLVVSPSAFSELEVDQGIAGRIMNYGSLEIRSQGGQQLNLILIKNPRAVSQMIRDVMTTPTVRIAKD